MPEINRSNRHQPEHPKREVNPSRHLVAESDATAKAAKSGIHPAGKASKGFSQYQVSRTPPNLQTLEKIKHISSWLCPHPKVKHKR